MSDASPSYAFVLDGQGNPASVSPQTIATARHDARTPLGAAVLSSCYEALVQDLSSLSPTERAASGITVDAPDALLDLPQRAPHNAIVGSVHLYLIQILRYIANIDGRPSRSIHPTFGVLGFSTGFVAASVIACADGLPQLVAHATEAFRLAFWIGLRAQQYAHRALRDVPTSAPEESWTLVTFGAARAEVQAAVDRYNAEQGTAVQVYLTAVTNDKCASVSGRPDALNAFGREHLPPSIIQSRLANIHTLYHSPDLESVKTQVMHDIASRAVAFPSYHSLRHTLRSPVDGEPIREVAGSTLAEQVVDATLLSPVNFDKVVSSIAASLSASDAGIAFVNLGPGSVLWRSTARALPSVRLTMLDWSSAPPAPAPAPTPPPAQPAVPDAAPAREPIAIVGMAVKFPGAPDADGLWRVLEQGLNTVSEIPASRFDVAAYSQGAARSLKTTLGNFIDDPDVFDNAFFRVSPREARSMDPQQRLLLHVAYHALEDAGYVPGATLSFDPETFATYIGAATNDYVQNLRNDVDVYYSTGTLQAFLSGKLSYAFKFSGPSLVVDTACSSSMVAIHQACRALSNGDCNAALAGGVNVITSPDYVAMGRGLYGSVPSFKSTVDRCHEKLVVWGYPGILGVICPREGQAEGDFRSFQAAVFVLECALAEMWTSWGVRPDAVVGHSLGEYAALVAAGVLSLEDGLKIVAGRAHLMAEKCTLDDTGMLAVKMSPVELACHLGQSADYDELSVACHNSCEDGVVAGKLSQLDVLQAELKASGRNQVDKVKVVPELVKADARYGVYCNVGFLSDSIAIGDAYAFELGTSPVNVVAVMKRMRFKKLRLGGFKAVLAAAASPAGPTRSAMVPGLSVDPQPGSMAEQIKGIMAHALGVSTLDIGDRQDLERLGLDSLTSIEARHTLCSALGVVLPENVFATCRTISDIVSAVGGHTTPRAASPSLIPLSPGESESTLNDGTNLDLARAATLVRVRGILASVLGLVDKDLRDDLELERMGMDSLMSIEAHHALSTALDADLPHDMFSTCKTVRDVQDLVAPQSVLAKQLGGTVSSSVVASSFGTEDNPVLLQDGRASLKPPLFLVHDGSGVAHQYGRLSPLGRRVWGIHNPKFPEGGKWDGGLPEMAEHYADLVKKTLGTASQCILGGWSIGGVIAFEVARRLIASGVDVAGLVLIDCPDPDTTTPLSKEILDAAFARSTPSRAVELARSSIEHATAALVQYDPWSSPVKHASLKRAVMLRCREPFSIERGDAKARSNSFLAHRRDPRTITAGWETVLGFQVPVLDVPGNHFEPFSPRYGEVYATRPCEKDAGHWVVHRHVATNIRFDKLVDYMPAIPPHSPLTADIAT
ncbi:hypothetical protein PHLGIDRAFT_36582 [Phlebiopsis gigantea 11061_1 CR5-6]|uniref:Carrier domain-containing protein n=1 Tax=Phlebiopsis gigantea (strain 11061_1 CR5-6) TaxID=745531 RepID=A0A0C3PH22_PHLG1|nr:hypothetical protein PHLGIDRAFT_36582 [Phlebiopsis gigantea 11061_1 CR5-6]